VKKFISILLILTSFIATTSYSLRPEKEITIGEDLIDKENLKAFLMILNIIKAKYVVEVNEKKLIEAALSGMLESLDPYSEYFTEEEYKQIMEHLNAEFGGIGVEFAFEASGMKVISPIEDTPAYRAGILPGDYIIEINHKPISEMTRFDAFKKMRGKPGSKVDITVIREEQQNALEFSLTRELIKFNTVKYSSEDDIAYIRVLSFSKNTAQDFKESYHAIIKENPNVKGLVIDLRSNPGGLVDQAIDIASLFVPSGNILIIREREREEAFPTKSNGTVLTEDLPVTVLIDKGSASSSEILAGALKDYGAAKIMGTKSYGKGTVQLTINRDLPKNYGGFKFTAAYFFTPKGQKINGVGITPDIIVGQKNLQKLISETQKLNYGKNHSKNISSKKIPDILWRKMLEYDNVLSNAVNSIKGESSSPVRKDK